MIEFVVIEKPHLNVISFLGSRHVWRTVNAKRWFNWSNFNKPHYNYPEEDLKFISLHISDDLKGYLRDDGFTIKTLHTIPLLLCYIDIL